MSIFSCLESLFLLVLLDPPYPAVDLVEVVLQLCAVALEATHVLAEVLGVVVVVVGKQPEVDQSTMKKRVAKLHVLIHEAFFFTCIFFLSSSDLA